MHSGLTGHCMRCFVGASRSCPTQDASFLTEQRVSRCSANVRSKCSFARKRFAVVECLYTSTRGRLAAFCGLSPAIGFNLRLYTSGLGCYPTKLALVSCAGLASSITYHLVLVASLKSRFTNSMRILAFVVLTFARTPRIPALCAPTVSSSSRRATTSS